MCFQKSVGCRAEIPACSAERERARDLPSPGVSAHLPCHLLTICTKNVEFFSWLPCVFWGFFWLFYFILFFLFYFTLFYPSLLPPEVSPHLLGMFWDFLAGFEPSRTRSLLVAACFRSLTLFGFKEEIKGSSNRRKPGKTRRNLGPGDSEPFAEGTV